MGKQTKGKVRGGYRLETAERARAVCQSLGLRVCGIPVRARRLARYCSGFGPLCRRGEKRCRGGEGGGGRVRWRGGRGGEGREEGYLYLYLYLYLYGHG